MTGVPSHPYGRSPVGEDEAAEPTVRRPFGPPPPPPDPVADLPPSDDPESPRHKSFWAHLLELPILIVVAFLIAVVIKTFLVQAFFIPSGSMEPTLQVGDRVLVEKLSYRFGEPERGHVVVFAQDVFGVEPPDVPWPEDAKNFVRELLGLPTGGEQDYIKRVVAVEGDVLSYRGDPRRLVVNGEEVDEPYIMGGADRTSSPITSKDCERMKLTPAEGGCRVPDGRVFVMGDNRSNSEDSRLLGPIRESKIVGHAFVVLWPPKDFGGL